MLARAGLNVLLIGRRNHVDAINQAGLLIDGMRIQETIRIAGSTSLEAARGADLVLFSVKSPDTEEVGRQLAAYVSRDVTVLCLQNGVDNADRLRAAAGLCAEPAVVYVAARMTGDGQLKHSGRGDLVIGNFTGSDALAALFERSEVPCRVSDNIEGELWTKLVMNCAYNAISALCRARYGRIGRHPDTRRILIDAVEETVAVAKAAGVRLPETDFVEDALALSVSMEQALSSTAQDIARGKRTEIDSLNGYVARRGADLGVPAPVNRTLHGLVKLLERTESGA
jgi:2-dehydropantoate 2-reductase